MRSRQVSFFRVNFQIGLPRREPFLFYVDAYGIPAGGGSGSSVETGHKLYLPCTCR